VGSWCTRSCLPWFRPGVLPLGSPERARFPLRATFFFSLRPIPLGSTGLSGSFPRDERRRLPQPPLGLCRRGFDSFFKWYWFFSVLAFSTRSSSAVGRVGPWPLDPAACRCSPRSWVAAEWSREQGPLCTATTAFHRLFFFRSLTPERAGVTHLKLCLFFVLLAMPVGGGRPRQRADDTSPPASPNQCRVGLARGSFKLRSRDCHRRPYIPNLKVIFVPCPPPNLFLGV